MAELPPRRWEVPFPYGYAASIDAMGSVAAPLFAGFAVTVAVQLLTGDHVPRWPNAALGLLLGAAFVLGASVQFAFRARQYYVTPSELEAWWPDADEYQRGMVRGEQRLHYHEHNKWSHRARLAYNAGLLTFLLGIAVALVPLGPIATGRLLVIFVTLLAFSGELTWMLRGLVDRLAKRGSEAGR